MLVPLLLLVSAVLLDSRFASLLVGDILTTEIGLASRNSTPLVCSKLSKEIYAPLSPLTLFSSYLVLGGRLEGTGIETDGRFKNLIKPKSAPAKLYRGNFHPSLDFNNSQCQERPYGMAGFIVW